MGQSVDVCWETAEEDTPEARDKPSPDDLAARRTAWLRGVLRFDYARRRPERTMHLTRWTRPGRGQLLFSALVPPGREEPLSIGTSLELQTVALTDLAGGGAQLKRREGTTRLLLPATSDPKKQTALMRLYLDIEALD